MYSSGNRDVWNWINLFESRCTMRMTENRVLGKVFGPKGKVATGDWIKYHNEEHHFLYVLQNGTWVIKWRKMRKVGHEVQWSKVTWREVKWSDVNWSEAKWCDVMWSELKCSEVMWSDALWSEVMWNEVKRSDDLVWEVWSLIYIYVAVCRFCAARCIIIICFSLLFSNYSTIFNILFTFVFYFYSVLFYCFVYCFSFYI